MQIFFVVPCAFDLFSLRAIKSVGRTISKWIELWTTISDMAPDDAPLLPAKPRFLGYIPQRFRTYGGEIAGAAKPFLNRIEKSVYGDIANVLKEVSPSLVPKPSQSIRLGEIKDFASLVPLSHDQGLPLWKVSSSTSFDYLKEQASDAFDDLAKAIINGCKVR